MTRTTNTFGAFAFAALAVFALWTSTLTMPLGTAPTSVATVAAPALA
ncbi:hypothetical protein [Novosphingobium sp. JCM 18896]|nr:hypothetical protein [Novosphingobium sp. JCM 18896]MCW1431527.1 hypothetical protein [Novosphingobium sp. JCM 18896]